jgi:DNA-binding NarL/FixJ family response regulator
MNTDTISILLVEDTTDADLIDNMLFDGVSFHPELVRVVRLSESLEQLSQRKFDVVLLDLTLPDSWGLESLNRILQQTPDIPIIVLTGASDEELAIEAIRVGAQDYLFKQRTNTELLGRAIRYAVERQRLLVELQRVRQREEQEQELHSLEQLSNPIPASVTAQLYGEAPLRVTLPDIFATLVEHYGELMDRALEQQAYKVERHVSEDLRGMAEKLGFLKAGPRDVIEIHHTTLKHKSRDASLAKIQAYVEEGRLMVLELMGHLVSFYRKYALGVRYISYSNVSTRHPPQNLINSPGLGDLGIK